MHFTPQADKDLSHAAFRVLRNRDRGGKLASHFPKLRKRFQSIKQARLRKWGLGNEMGEPGQVHETKPSPRTGHDDLKKFSLREVQGRSNAGGKAGLEGAC